jgi:hypothetical protein
VNLGIVGPFGPRRDLGADGGDVGHHAAGDREQHRQTERADRRQMRAHRAIGEAGGRAQVEQTEEEDRPHRGTTVTDQVHHRRAPRVGGTRLSRAVVRVVPVRILENAAGPPA